MARWIASFIFPLGVDLPWVEGQGLIKKETLNFAAKFWWLIVRYHLCLIPADNLLAWDRTTVITSMAAGYDIDFLAIIRYEIHE